MFTYLPTYLVVVQVQHAVVKVREVLPPAAEEEVPLRRAHGGRQEVVGTHDGDAVRRHASLADSARAVHVVLHEPTRVQLPGLGIG